MITKIKLLQNQRLELVLYLTITLFATIFLIIRAIDVPMAHDEIASFFYFVQNGKISPFFSNPDTNNHFLNSFLMWISYKLFGNSPLALRLPNLLFIPIYFFALVRIVKLLKSNLLRIFTFSAMAFTLHFIEFLALARGYGMSLALLILSLFFVMQWVFERKNIQLFGSLVSIFIASLANLALINYYVLLLMAVVCWQAFYVKQKNKQALLVIISSGFLPFSLIVSQILYIKSKAGLIAGASNDFWNTTIASLFGYLFELKSPYASLLPAIVFAWISIAFIMLVHNKMKQNALTLTNGILVFYFFSGSIVITLILGLLFNINYPDDRIATYLFPLLLFGLVFITDELIGLRKKKMLHFISLPVILIPLHFFAFINSSYSIWYKPDVIPNRFYNTVMSNYKTGSTPPTIAAHGLRIFCWSYLSYSQDGNASPIFFTTFPSYKADYQIVNLKMIPDWNKYYDTIDYDNISERHLLKLKNQATITPLIEHRCKLQNTSDEYIVLAEGNTDSLVDMCAQVNLDLNISSPYIPLNARIVIDISDSTYTSFCYEYIQLNWLRANWQNPNSLFSNCLLVDKVPKQAKLYKIYIWNIEKKEISVEGKITINERIVR